MCSRPPTKRRSSCFVTARSRSACSWCWIRSIPRRSFEIAVAVNRCQHRNRKLIDLFPTGRLVAPFINGGRQDINGGRQEHYGTRAVNSLYPENHGGVPDEATFFGRRFADGRGLRSGECSGHRYCPRTSAGPGDLRYLPAMPRGHVWPRRRMRQEFLAHAVRSSILAALFAGAAAVAHNRSSPRRRYFSWR